MSTDVLIFQVTQEMIHNWGWFLAFGIVLMLLGIAANRSVRQRYRGFHGVLRMGAGVFERH